MTGTPLDDLEFMDPIELRLHGGRVFAGRFIRLCGRDEDDDMKGGGIVLQYDAKHVIFESRLIESIQRID